ncbi:MAG: UDP-N-acetylglucosamine--N-acetylmuramyl-(pentapeptide) pyrophosphoryl-undecaprenol N-acetylglucosamine transferase [Thermoleophilia bacterium]|nr:UDP-N-acetylglucosamine--N-acetylmuramyl-(pentapeptide) pyrophosphoryl-undecaprenol N-acetylglucosamine transferase [Thermoleophilia bacterium]
MNQPTHTPTSKTTNSTSSTTSTAASLRVVVAAGGTAGHLAPALAVADRLRDAGHLVTFVTSMRPGDEQLVAARGYGLHKINVVSLPRKLGPGQLGAVVTAVRAVWRARRLVRQLAPNVVLAGGGFVSTPAAVAAGWKRIPVVVTEADAHLGLANRISTRRAARLCTAYPLPGYPRKQWVTGRPVTPDFAVAGADRAGARRALGISSDAMVLLVTTGSGGATRVNRTVREAFATDTTMSVGGRQLVVLHVTGRRDFAEIMTGIEPHAGYRIIEFADNMPQLIAAADLVLSRGGGSVFEMAAAGRACVLVPFPTATGNHQTKNAAHVASSGGAVVIADADLDVARVRGIVGELLADSTGDQRRHAMEQAITTFARPMADLEIAAAIEQLGAAHERRAAR